MQVIQQEKLVLIRHTCVCPIDTSTPYIERKNIAFVLFDANPDFHY